MLDGLKGEDSITELCRREGIAQSLYYCWSKEFLEAGKKRIAGDTARAATLAAQFGNLDNNPSCRASVNQSAP